MSHKECVVCPFSLICLMGRFVNDSSIRGRVQDRERAQVYLCPECGCVGQEQHPFVRQRCPERKLKGSWKASWRAQYKMSAQRDWAKACQNPSPTQGVTLSMDTMSVTVHVDDPMYPDRRLYIYLCDHCYANPPNTGLQISIYDAGEPP